MTGQPAVDFDRVVRTVCSPSCLGTCGVNAFVKDDRIVKLEPATYPEPGFERICLRGIAMATQRLHHPDRIRYPMMRAGARGENKWRRISWDEAYDHIIRNLNAIAERDGRLANAWLRGSGNYGIRAGVSAIRTMNLLGGTLFSNGGLSGDLAGMEGYYSTLGEFGCSNEPADLVGAKYLLSAGRNIADTAHCEMHFLFDAMEAGCKFVMIDPRFTRSAAKADDWLPVRPGADVALALGMVNVVVNAGLVKEDYVLAHTNGAFLARRDTQQLLRERDVIPGGGDAYMVWDEARGAPTPVAFAERPLLRGAWTVAGAAGAKIECWTAFEASWAEWRKYTPDYASAICDVPAEQIRRTALDYATADPAWLWMGYGPQRYHHGHLVTRAWATLATLCGNIGKRYAGMSYCDGPLFSMLMNPWRQLASPKGARRGRSLNGTTLVDAIATGAPYEIRSLWMSASGFATQTPLFRRFVEEALPKLDLFVVTEQVMTAAAEQADIVLPCTSYYEEDWDLVGGGEIWFMQLRRQAVAPVGESRSDYDIFKGLCERMGLGEYWQTDPEEECRLILANSPDPRIRAVDWETLKRDGVARVPLERPHTPFADMTFKTPSGRIELYQEQFADQGEAVVLHREPLESHRAPHAKRYPLVLISYKHTHSTHGQHSFLPYMRELLPHPFVEISPDDAAARGIEEGDTVSVFNERAEFKVKAQVSEAVRPGTLAIKQGWWPRDFGGQHPAFLGHLPRNAVQERLGETNTPHWDVLCEVRKAAPSEGAAP